VRKYNECEEVNSNEQNHPKKARYVNSIIWNKILEAYQKEEIKLFKE
jgi:hypothetical protein